MILEYIHDVWNLHANVKRNEGSLFSLTGQGDTSLDMAGYAKRFKTDTTRGIRSINSRTTQESLRSKKTTEYVQCYYLWIFKGDAILLFL